MAYGYEVCDGGIAYGFAYADADYDIAISQSSSLAIGNISTFSYAQADLDGSELNPGANKPGALVITEVTPIIAPKPVPPAPPAP